MDITQAEFIARITSKLHSIAVKNLINMDYSCDESDAVLKEAKVLFSEHGFQLWSPNGGLLLANIFIDAAI